ncbi:Single domain Von Willebrand factor type C domain [Trinorchestia longiramus]|nr:Single domain Von Willebrand factor type C domain [Trinorchestia longiramus]
MVLRKELGHPLHKVKHFVCVLWCDVFTCDRRLKVLHKRFFDFHKQLIRKEDLVHHPSLSSTRMGAVLYVMLATAALLIALDSSSAAIARGLAHINPEYPGSCWDENRKVAIKVGEEVVSAGSCESVGCDADMQGRLYFTFTGCGLIIPPPGCRVEMNPALGYPACCYNLVCD